MRLAIIGQSLFASSVLKLLQSEGHEIVGVFTIPDKNGREDSVATAAKENNVPVFKIARWRVKGKIIKEVFDDYCSVNAELNILPFCTQFIPLEVVNFPKYGSIGYHPSLLPRHRGASAINWTLISGDQKAGFSIFWPDDGLDTGPILLQRECDVEENDTVDTIYNRFLFPEGVIAFKEAVNLISAGMAPKTIQSDVGATYDPMLNKPELSEIHFDKLSGKQLHDFIRGMDKVPGAWFVLENQTFKAFGSRLYSENDIPQGMEVEVKGMSRPGVVSESGLILFGNDGKAVVVTKLMFENGKMIAADKYGQDEIQADFEFTEEEKKFADIVAEIWESILRSEVALETDFFKSGAGSMDVTRLVEEVKEKCLVELENEDVYMASTLGEFVKTVVLKNRGTSKGPKLVFEATRMQVNKREISFPTQLFINNQFVNAKEGSKPLISINPTDESVICEVQSATVEDVDKAVTAAKVAFEEGEWSKMNARDRGKIIYKLADLLEQHKEELAIIESLDSGAVYTLALKTHIGMSIETWRYFAGWCDKIEGSTIPINHARPNRNLTITKKEPIGVCGIITPWNYPLMMVSWKMAACLAAGNTVVLKPAQVSPLTALKLAELSVYAGFPPGVINVLPGTGSVCGQAIAEHLHIRKLGFTGSTPIGKEIMRSCAISNLKKVSLELGGKSPLIIFADADFDKSVRQAMNGVFFNKGENCIAAGRVFVENSIHDRFVAKVVEETKKIVIGDPLDRSTSHGPQNHRKHLEKLLEYCEIGVKEGAKLVYGGKQVPRPGLFFMPTIFTEVSDHMYIAREESFGPIMVISRFKDGDIEEVLRRANNTEYGLASGVFTKDISKALLIGERIQAGTCFVNCYNKTDVAAPFGGFKQSGFGKDLGQEALNEYLKIKTITIEY